MEEQVGVNAPGREKRTILLPLKRSSLVRSFQSKGFSSEDSMRVRVLNVTLGMAVPSEIAVVVDMVEDMRRANVTCEIWS